MIRALLIFLLLATVTVGVVAFRYGPWAGLAAWVGVNAGLALGLTLSGAPDEVVS
ncbi:MAG: hypothetical protein M3N21_05655 [Actinomycetota bacterium]|nr:hypothetical protein [Actinomycetota bacterium]